ncbi:MAG: ATP-binding cassette domain-containing protein [Clostridiaceae bacterium]|nr:ATP-binding cassette domain-containing protein [Clostridiaceae bacterium]
MIRIKGATLTYKDGTTALKDINLNIGAGELVYITGPSGSGKTSLLKLLMGVEYPSEGEVLVLGQKIAKEEKRRIRRLRRNIGPVFQDFRVIKGRTALENVMMGVRFLGFSPKKMKSESLNALEKVGLKHKYSSLVENLSWGECQRVAIARAIIRKPALILADEPTGNLDLDNAVSILELLSSLRDDKTSVLITTHATHLIDNQKDAVFIRINGGRITMEQGGRA